MEFVQVLVVNTRAFELVDFGDLDILNFLSLIFNFLSNFSALLEVVESVLLLDVFVACYLGSDFGRVVDLRLLLLLLDSSLLHLHLLLLLYLMHVVLSLDSGLFG